MAIGHARTGEETRQVQMVCVDDLVPADDGYRRVERLVSWPAVRASAAPFYSGVGRPSIDPAVLVKVFLVAAIEGIGSMRETLRVAERDVAIRRFLGFGLTERLPSHATFSYAQCVRFANSSVFEQLFTQVLAQCRQAGLLDGQRLIVDATHIEANAALKSLRAELEVIDGGADTVPEPEPEPEPESLERPALRLAEPRSGPTPKRRASNATAVSRSDPDAKLRHKPGQRPHLVHRAQVATDPKARVIVAVRAEPATGHEADSLTELVTRARWAGHQVSELVADQGYASAASYAQLDGLGVTAFVPPRRDMRHTPHGQAARTRCLSPPGVEAAIDRQTHGEGAISELKLQHALDRARCRSTAKVHLQLLLAATAINLKRLTRRPEAAQNDAHGDYGTMNTPIPVRRDHITAHLTVLAACLTRLAPPHHADSLTGS